MSGLLAHLSVHGHMVLLPLDAGLPCLGSLGWCLRESTYPAGRCWRGQGCRMVNPWERGVTLWLKTTLGPGSGAKLKPCWQPWGGATCLSPQRYHLMCPSPCSALSEGLLH